MHTHRRNLKAFLALLDSVSATFALPNGQPLPVLGKHDRRVKWELRNIQLEYFASESRPCLAFVSSLATYQVGLAKGNGLVDANSQTSNTHAARTTPKVPIRDEIDHFPSRLSSSTPRALTVKPEMSAACPCIAALVAPSALAESGEDSGAEESGGCSCCQSRVCQSQNRNELRPEMDLFMRGQS